MRLVFALIVGVAAGYCLAQRSWFTVPQSVCYNCTENAQNQSNVSITSDNQTTLADQLAKEVRVLCWIMTSPKNHDTKALAVKRTWGKRCNKLLFMSSVDNEYEDTITLQTEGGRDNLWGRTKAAFKYVYEHHFDEADWFLKADDDTYTIIENLRYMLYSHDAATPIYFGHKFKPLVQQGYMSGGAGYVLSREAVRRFVVEALPNPKLCKQHNGGVEDAALGKCLQNVKVVAGDSRDGKGRGRFFPFIPQDHVYPYHDNTWYWEYQYYKSKDGPNLMSDYPISFHYIPPRKMYTLEYLIYKLKIFGIKSPVETLQKALPITNESTSNTSEA
ncbi:CG2983 [Drosophila busckii]|uniref:Glycoprotein-N-acetylgalactosamine 3-beta-galactosyltransferase 1 n=1 Tax=Drosophila busckii TaxID=30019 RepID=A0A0M4EN72_DROBS|nr:CG2983 [Drosophila busckii]